MIDRQSQEVGAGATAFQARGDLIVHTGLQAQDVKELCLLYLQQNFPQLRDEAIDAARKNVESYIPILQAAIIGQAENIDIASLADPDIQASINESVQGSARKGEAANLHLLAEMVGTRMRSDRTPILSIVAEEAIRVVSRLTPPQIAFLALCQFLNRMQFSATSVEHLELHAILAWPTLAVGLNLSDANMRHTQYVGATSILNMVESAYYQIFRERYPFLAAEESLHDFLKEKAPVFYQLAEQYRISKVYNATLTPVGELIALMTLRKVSIFQGIDYKVWIN